MKKTISLFLALVTVLALVVAITESTALARNDDSGGQPGWSNVPGRGASDPPAQGDDAPQADTNEDSGNQPGWTIVPGRGRPGPSGQEGDGPQGTPADDPGEQPGWSQAPGRRGAPGRGNG